MTVAEPRPPDPAPSAPGAPAAQAPEILQCPYLTSSDGSWRAATAARDHRCGAVTPPAPLATEKQKRLCLTADHVACATYVAAETALGALPGRAAGLPRPVARTAPVVLDRRRFGEAVPAVVADRSIGQAMLVAVLVVAFLVVVIARSAVGGAAPGPSTSPSPSPSVIASATPRPTPTPTPRPTATPSPTATPTPIPSASARASARPRATPRPTKKAEVGPEIITVGFIAGR